MQSSILNEMKRDRLFGKDVTNLLEFKPAKKDLRGNHLPRSQVMRGDPVRIEPDPHGVVPVAEYRYTTNPIETRQRILHMQRGIVGEIKLVARGIR